MPKWKIAEVFKWAGATKRMGKISNSMWLGTSNMPAEVCSVNRGLENNHTDIVAVIPPFGVLLGRNLLPRSRIHSLTLT